MKIQLNKRKIKNFLEFALNQYITSKNTNSKKFFKPICPSTVDRLRQIIP